MKADHIGVLVKHRLEQAGTALEDARFLLDGERSPQSIINRSYYAMFYAVLALLQTIDKVPSKHAGVISLFDREFVLKNQFPKELSKDLHKAFELRQVADYKAIEPTSIEKAEDLLNKADRFVKAIREYLQDNGEMGMV
jgi:uncharacterized protein (UPF0332 family)